MPSAVGAGFIVKGLRTGGDFEVEQQMAHTNHAVTGVRTVYLPCSPIAVRSVAASSGRSRSTVGRRPPGARAGRRRLAPGSRREGHAGDDHELRRHSTTTTTTRSTTSTPTPRRRAYVGDAETLLRRAIDIIATAPTMPLSSSPRIDRDEIIELLDEALPGCPTRCARRAGCSRSARSSSPRRRREADELLEAARVQAERMVQRTEVVRAAEQRARQVIETAETDARRLRHETEDFLDQRLGSFEILLDKLQQDRRRRP